MTAAGLAGLGGCRREVEPGPGRPPNIVFIMLDDAGYADFGCYGQQKIQTPNIDRFAAEAVKFTDCYAGGAVCAPSRCTLMTGYHTGHGSIRANAGTAPILDEDVTVAELLRPAGYVSGVFGKWGLGDAHTAGVPTKQGFDEFFGYLHQIHAHTYYPEFLWENETKYPLPGNANGAKKQYSADIIANKALDFVRRHQDRPFFLYGAFTLPHGHYEVPSDAPYTDRDWPQEEKNYAAMVTRFDRDIGRLFGLLERLGIDETTVVFFSSDNGPHKEGGADPEFFERAVRLAKKHGLKYAYADDIFEGSERVTECPKDGEPLIIRIGDFVLVKLGKGNKCPRCGEIIPIYGTPKNTLNWRILKFRTTT